jgi:hypothetical protein
VPLAGFANLDADIHNAGGEVFAAAINDILCVVLPVAVTGHDVCDYAVLDQQAAAGLGRGLWINEFGIYEQGAVCLGHDPIHINNAVKINMNRSAYVAIRPDIAASEGRFLAGLI